MCECLDDEHESSKTTFGRESSLHYFPFCIKYQYADAPTYDKHIGNTTSLVDEDGNVFSYGITKIHKRPI